MSDRGKPRINRNGSVPTRERNPEFVALTDGVVRLGKNEVAGIDREIPGSNYLATYSRLSQIAQCDFPRF
jgi:hypothetical protein